MPISALEFEGFSPATEKWLYDVYAFLKEHEDLAYTEDELREAVPGETDVLTPQALEFLHYMGGIDERFVRGSAYYAFLADITL